MLSVIVFGISPAVSAVSDLLPTRMKAYSTDGGNYLRDVFMNGEGQYVDKMGSLINEADVIDPDLMKNLTTNLTPQTPNPTPQVTPTPSANPSATNTHWGVNRDTGAMEKLTKQGNRFYDQAGNQISAKGENIKTYKYDELDKANKYAEGIAKKRMSGSTGTGGAGGTGATGGSAGGIAQKIGYEGVGTLNVGQAIGGAVELGVGSTMLGNSIMKEGIVDAKDVAVGGLGGGMATHGAVNMLRSSGIPIGPVTTTIAVSAGAVLGSAATATRIATQNDCFYDTVLKMYACCHTVAGNTALSGGVLYDIGEATHCTGSDGRPRFGYITYCGQKDLIGSGTYKTYQGVHKNDEWLDCEESWCDGWKKPENSEMKIDTIAFWQMRKDGSGTLPCWKWECSEKGMKREGNKCVPDPNAKNKPEDEEPDGKNPNPAAPKKTCNDLYAGHPERLACCKAGKTTKWSDPNDLDGGYCYCVDVKTQLPDNTKTWNGAKCIDASQETDCTYTFSAKIICANGGVVDANTMVRLEKDDLNGKSCNDFKSLLNRDQSAIMKLAEKYCTPVEPVVVPEPDSKPEPTIDFNAVNAARDRLAAFFKQVDSDRSVWKNADGSFNATRLASDLTAGVVLGTVGGVVSGVLIKKSQVEKGFDALNCTVNGQKVADWGDEFRINFRM